MPRTSQSKVEYVALQVKQRIELGHYPPGYRLPPVSDLVREFRTSRDTIVAALGRLLGEGYLYQRQSLASAAWIVRSQRKPMVVDASQLDQFLGAREQQTIVQNVIDPEIIPASAEVAHLMQLTQGTPVIHLLRTYGTEEMIICLQELWYPAKMTASLMEAMRTNPALDVISEIRRMTAGGVTPATFQDEIATCLPTTQEAQLLRTPRTTPVLMLTRTILNTHGQVIALVRSLFIGGWLSLRFQHLPLVPSAMKEPDQLSEEKGGES